MHCHAEPPPQAFLSSLWNTYTPHHEPALYSAQVGPLLMLA